MTELPPPEELADNQDELAWTSAEGPQRRMAAYATPDEATPTVPADEYTEGE